MARIDLLTAQMCRRAAKRLSIQCDEKMQFFGAGGELLGEGAAVSGSMIHEFLLPIAPIPFDGVPVSFSYKGCDGEFKILVAAKCRGFEIHAISFIAARARQAFPEQTTPEGRKPTFTCAWSSAGNSYSAWGKLSMPNSGPRSGIYERREDATEEVPKEDTD